MVELRLSEIAEIMDGKILQGSPSLSFQKFNIDSRLTTPGELFFALTSKRNGHDFIPDALNKGASGAVISREMVFPNKDFALIQVSDSLTALQTLAKSVLSTSDAKVVGITGSIGKTTTKEFAFSLLSRSFCVLKSEGNFNNHLGLPLSLLKLTEKHEIAVLEMGMSAARELSPLTQIAPPDVAVITNIKPVHLEFFQNIEEIALAKKEILDGMKNDGTAVLNGDDLLVKKIAKGLEKKTVFFGLSEKCDIRARNVRKMGMEGLSFEIVYGQKAEKLSIPFLYESYLSNYLAAAAVASVFSVPFEDILEQTKTLKPFSMRGVLFSLKGDIKLIDDTYNSNPAALEAALKSLSDLPAKRKVAVLGDMLELGEKEIDFHFQAGKQVKEMGWDILITVGPLSKHMADGAISSGFKRGQVFSFKDAENAAEDINSLIKEGDLILVKGSRGVMTEIIVNELKQKRS